MKFLIVLLIVFVSILVFAGALYFYQKKLIFYPTPIKADYQFRFKIPHQEHLISYHDNRQIHALSFSIEQARARILYFHGNGGSLDSWGFLAAELAERTQSNVMMVDYPGYGKSSPPLPRNEVELYACAEAALKTFNTLPYSELPLIIYGRSLGSSLATHLARTQQLQALILESPFVSLKKRAAELLPFIPSFLLRFDLDNEKNLEDSKVPALAIYGTHDTIIPAAHSKYLASRFPQINLARIDGADHNNIDQFPAYWAELNIFYSSLGLSR